MPPDDCEDLTMLTWLLSAGDKAEPLLDRSTSLTTRAVLGPRRCCWPDREFVTLPDSWRSCVQSALIFPAGKGLRRAAGLLGPVALNVVGFKVTEDDRCPQHVSCATNFKFNKLGRHTFELPILSARDSTLPGFCMPEPEPGALARRPLPKICCANCSFFRRARSERRQQTQETRELLAQASAPLCIMVLKSTAVFVLAMISRILIWLSQKCRS